LGLEFLALRQLARSWGGGAHPNAALASAWPAVTIFAAIDERYIVIGADFPDTRSDHVLSTIPPTLLGYCDQGEIHGVENCANTEVERASQKFSTKRDPPPKRVQLWEKRKRGTGGEGDSVFLTQAQQAEHLPEQWNAF